jgi:hypothetical protein
MNHILMMWVSSGPKEEIKRDGLPVVSTGNQSPLMENGMILLLGMLTRASRRFNNLVGKIRLRSSSALYFLSDRILGMPSKFWIFFNSFDRFSGIRSLPPVTPLE